MTEQQPVIEIKDVTKTYTMGEARADLTRSEQGPPALYRCLADGGLGDRIHHKDQIGVHPFH